MYSIHGFVPFEHENHDVKNNLINLARTQDRNTPEGALAATLIYANLVDYLARHLLSNLQKMISIFTYKKFGGIFHLNCYEKKNNLPLGELIRELEAYEFPNRSDVIKLFKEFKNSRNEVAHNLMALDPKDTTKNIDTDITKIVAIAEDLLTKYNVIAGGLVSIWNIANAAAPESAEEKAVETEAEVEAELEDKNND